LFESLAGTETNTSKDYNNSSFVSWERDQNDLLCKNFRKQQLPGTTFSHLMRTGNDMVLTNG